MFGEGGTKTWVGRRLCSQDQTNLECGSDLVNILIQILLSFFCMDFALKFGGEDKKSKKKGLHCKILGNFITFTWSVWLFHRKNRLWWPVFGQKFASCAIKKVYSRLGSTSSDLGGTRFEMPSPVHRRSQDFWLGGQTKNDMQWRHQKFSKKELFVGPKYRRMEDQKPWPGLVLSREFSKGRGLEAKATNENI